MSPYERPKTFEKIYGRARPKDEWSLPPRSSLSARPSARRESASRDDIRDREHVLHERGRAARRRRLEAPRHRGGLAETTPCRVSRNRERARREDRVGRQRCARDRATTEGAEEQPPKRRVEGVAG